MDFREEHIDKLLRQKDEYKKDMQACMDRINTARQIMARNTNDRSENQEYLDAKLDYDKAVIEAGSIEQMLKSLEHFSKVYSEAPESLQIVEGTVVELELQHAPDDMQKEYTLLLVPEGLGNIREGYLDITSPVGQTLYGSPRDTTEITLKVPNGTVNYKVRRIY